MPLPFDWVVNCAASGGEVEDYRRVYVEGNRQLLQWLGSTPPTKFVYTSSTSVYGQNDGSVVDEASPADPGTDTAAVSREAEGIVIEAARGSNLPTVILRVSGIYGPHRGYWFKQYLKGEARLDGQGERFLNMIHRDDVVGCIIAALSHGKAGQIYNAVDDEPVSQRQFFEWLAQTLGGEIPTAAATASQNRKRSVSNKRVSNQKLKKELGYTFKYPTFREGYMEKIERTPSLAQAKPQARI